MRRKAVRGESKTNRGFRTCFGKQSENAGGAKELFFFAEQAACVSCTPFLFEKAQSYRQTPFHMRRVRMLFFVEEGEFVLLHHIRMPLSELAAPVLSLFGVLWVFDVACPPAGLNAPPPPSPKTCPFLRFYSSSEPASEWFPVK